MSNEDPQTVEEHGVEFTRAPDPDATRAALADLLDERPQLAALALDLLGAITKHEPSAWSSGEIVRSVRRGRRAQRLAEREADIEARFPTEQRPHALALAQIADTRKAGEKAVEQTPQMIKMAGDAGIKAPDIARLSDLTPSYVYRILRERSAEGATSPTDRFQRDMLLAFEEFEHDRAAANRAEVAKRLPAGHVLYDWRLDLFNGPDGEGWRVWESGTDTGPEGCESHLAKSIIENGGHGPAEHKTRVLIWEGEQGPDDAALFRYEHTPDEQ
ncbi:hypothetical protein C9F11_20110 [Streptomyces sp. YIM 121038]|uniref:hypothetical protein n=1 Tax=Streptomyces sp. YIM 121038 TaxID=2136401 RepID=UPI0011103E99|nr:hypothetical protein [Streptomyces sp. YIM 121038]QCX77657.1 hypothetical protein C9F11_20110 [Streptomyces sp. YIM 121038]